jgi:hypothetical protein
MSYEAVVVSVNYQPSGPPTFVEVGPLPWTGLELLDELGGAGHISVSAPVDKLDSDVKRQLRDLSQTPSEVWIRRNDDTAVIAAGQLTSCRIQSRTVTLTAPGLLSYLSYWLRDTDYTASGIDQAVIVKQLVDAWQAQSYGNDGLTTTNLVATGVNRDLTLQALDGKFIMPVVQTMGARESGFDLWVNPATRAIMLASPRRGVDRTNDVILDQRSIGQADIGWSVAPGVIGSECFGSSNSTQGASLSSIRSNTALRATFGRSYIARSWSDISIQGTLDAHVTRALADSGTQLTSIAPGVLPVFGFSYGDFAPGDLITYDFDAGLGRQTFPIRVASIGMTATSGREALRVGVL